VPVIAAGRIEPEAGDRLIREGKADVIAMGRQLLADPELAAKLAEGRAEDVRPCIYCYVCVAQPFFDRKVRCAVNPVAACEGEFAERLRTPAEPRRRVLVVGGGPAGMEAACVAALRGHEVVLCEKGAQLGGTLRFAALPYEPNRLEQEATPDLVRELAPDVVIAAVGARRERASIPGAERTHVFDGDDLRELLSGAGSSQAKRGLSIAGRLAVGAGRMLGVTSDPAKLRRASFAYMPVGRRVAIVGGGLVGAELAEFLVERGREVVVIEEGPVIGLEMAHPRRWRVLHELREAGARLVTGARVREIGETTLCFETGAAPDAEPTVEEIPADTVILATGLEANPEPIERLRTAGVPLVAIGDATGVGYLEGAIHEGFHAAIEL
jgi:2,4-dienoyl-CoA reductase (NADPH2)